MSKLAKKIFYALHGNDYFPQYKGLAEDEWNRFKTGVIATIDDVITEIEEKKARGRKPNEG